MLYDNLKDIISHTKGFFDSVKLANENNETTVQAIADGSTIILHGKLSKSIPDITTCIGLTRMNILEGMLRFPPFAASASKIEFQKQDKNGVQVLNELKFESTDGHSASYRFMSPIEAEKKIQVPPFNGATWDIEVEITKKNLSDLSHFAGVLGGSESTFKVSAKGGKLDFKIGGTGADRTIVPIATGITKSLAHEHSWRLSEVISLLKLGETGKCKLCISDLGVLKIELNSGLGVYNYYLVSMAS